MMSGDLGLRSHCHINYDGENDKFVGIKYDDGKIMAYFPLGYNLSETEDNIRNDIIQLITVLSAFAESKDQLFVSPNNSYNKLHSFPISAYITIIRLFLEQQNYYSEKEIVKRIGNRGKIDWSVSLKRNISFYQKNGTPFFNNFTIKGATPNENNLITNIHKFCVYEAFKKVGWIFTPYMPQDPHIALNKNIFLFVLKKKRANVFNDNEKLLFEAMISMLDFLNEDSDRTFYFGTDRFEYVWEKLINEVFGVANKDEYFPRSNWYLKYGKQKVNHALEPDTIMKYNEEIFILDAKYYRYGVTGKPNHLPESASINKQITYGEYVDKKLRKSKIANTNIYNAFLMPYNKSYNPFKVEGMDVENVGEARGEWKHNAQVYERVQGIVIDTRFLINSYFNSRSSVIKELTTAIKDAILYNQESYPGSDRVEF